MMEQEQAAQAERILLGACCGNCMYGGHLQMYGGHLQMQIGGGAPAGTVSCERPLHGWSDDPSYWHDRSHICDHWFEAPK